MDIKRLVEMGIAGVSGIVCVTVFVLFGNPANAELGPPVPAEKKIIGFACDLVDATYLKNHIAELERLPIDGLVISVHPDDKKSSEVGRINLSLGGQFKREHYKQAIANLKETKFTRFTDNFIDFSLCGNNAYDWFDDERWSIYAKNAAVLASVAKQAGLKGLEMDVEQYGGANVPVPYPFSYKWRKDRSQRSFEEVATRVRHRGRELIEAITAEYPDITIIVIPTLGWDDAPESDLLPAFADGILEGLGPKAKLIDGIESAYPLMLQENFSKIRQIAQKNGIEKSRVPELYKKNVQYAFGFWVDFDARFGGSYNGWHTDPKEFAMNYRSPERLEHSLYNALTISDRYAWLFVIHPQVWWQPHLLEKENVAKQMEYSQGWRCKLCPHSEIPEEYLDAIRNCRKPHDLDWGPAKARSMEDDALQSWCRVLAKGKGLKPEDLIARGENMLKNGGFETWGKGNTPDGWNLPELKFLSKENAVKKEGAYSIKVSSKDAASGIYISQPIPAEQYHGKTITFGIWTKSNVEDAGSVNVIDFIETTGRRDEIAEKYTRYEGEDGWWFLTAKKTIRPNAVSISFYLGTSFPPDGGVIYYDGAIAVAE